LSETIFKEVRYDLEGLIKFIELGVIGLPDIQRPFVWKNAKVRDLFDSIYHGYPIGYFLFWQNALSDENRAIGAEKKQKAPNLLIVDGQQRLTSFYAVIKGVPVLRENYKAESIEIAFNPILDKFEVADAAIRKDKAYIPNISKVWSDDTDLFEIVDEYFEKLESTRDVNDEEKKQIKKSISRLQNLLSFPFTALELSSNIDEELIAEVFVRINSKGQPLNQADFILTLMSVFWDEGRMELERFCKEARVPSLEEASPFNHFIKPDPDQILRVGVGLGFKRARLKYVYSILRGKNLETEQFSDELRLKQFDVLKRAQACALNLQYWHDFMKIVMQAGYRSEKMISSQNNLLFVYTLYLFGRTEYNVDEYTLRRVISRWFFMSSITGRYTGSPESAMEFDLARFRDVKDAQSFINILEAVCDQTLTRDYWEITLPNELATSSPRSPSLFAYYASLVLLDAKVLFSKLRVSDLLDPSTKAHRSAIERHHLFPKGYLKTINITELRETNQIANYALVEWDDNSNISDQAPADYAPEYIRRHSDSEIKSMYYWHALPANWENMNYNEFLIKRRELISNLIHDAYLKLKEVEDADKTPPEVVKIEDMIYSGETPAIEFKSTLRINMHTGQKDQRMELGCLKTIAGFLNTNGGTLIIGVADDGTPVGIEEDKFTDEDKMNLHLVNLIRDKIAPQFMTYIHPRFEEYNGKRIMAVECWKSKSPVFVKDGNIERFYIRTGAATTELTASQMQEFIKHRFNG
jgi:hypothetical protein